MDLNNFFRFSGHWQVCGLQGSSSGVCNFFITIHHFDVNHPREPSLPCLKTKDGGSTKATSKTSWKKLGCCQRHSWDQEVNSRRRLESKEDIAHPWDLQTSCTEATDCEHYVVLLLPDVGHQLDDDLRPHHLRGGDQYWQVHGDNFTRSCSFHFQRDNTLDRWKMSPKNLVVDLISRMFSDFDSDGTIIQGQLKRDRWQCSVYKGGQKAWLLTSFLLGVTLFGRHSI